MTYPATTQTVTPVKPSMHGGMIAVGILSIGFIALGIFLLIQGSQSSADVYGAVGSAASTVYGTLAVGGGLFMLAVWAIGLAVIDAIRGARP